MSLRITFPSLLLVSLLGTMGCGKPSGQAADGGTRADAQQPTDGDLPSDGALPGDGSIPNPPGSMVTGRVVDALGVAQAQVTVEVAGALAITGADGRFTTPAPAALPFELRVSGVFSVQLPGMFPPPPSTRRVGVLFMGVDRLDPTLMLPVQGSSVSPTVQARANVEFTVSGLGRPDAAQAGVVISPLGGRTFAYPWTYSAPASWTRTTPTVDSPPTAVSVLFIGYGPTYLAAGKSAELMLHNGEMKTGVDIVTAAPTTSTLSATVSASAAFTSMAGSPVLVFGNTTNQLGSTAALLSGASPLSTPVPVMDGALYDLSISASGAPRTARAIVRALAAGTNAGAVTLPEPPALIEPLNNGTVPLSGTAFRVQQPDDRVRTFFFDYDDVSLVVVSTDKQVSFPDLSPVGIAAPWSGTKVGWRVTSYTAPSISAALGSNGYTSTLVDRGAVVPGEIFVEASSESFQFTVE
ncbi:MAG: hypothetical protein ABI321_11210 [Polyangia bacterium]